MKPTLLAAALAALLPCLALAAPVSFAEAEAQVATTAGQRDPYAHYALAQRYMERHAPGDQSKAMSHYRAAALLGHTDAQWRLADMLFDMASSAEEPDAARLLQEAQALLKHAADAGNQTAMRNLAARLAQGQGMKADPGAALQWRERLADAGDAQAAFDVAATYFAKPKGAGDAQGTRYLTVAADAGLPGAVNELADRLEQGRGMAMDLEAAHKRATQAVALKIDAAQGRLARLDAALAPPPPVPAPTITKARPAKAKLAVDAPAITLARTRIEPPTAPIVPEPVAEPAAPIAPMTAQVAPVATPVPPSAPSKAAAPVVIAPMSVPGQANTAALARDCEETTALRAQLTALLEKMQRLENERAAPPPPAPPALPPLPQEERAAPKGPVRDRGPALAFEPAAPAIAPSEINEKALTAMREHDMPRALRLFDQAAKAGDVNAMNNLGMVFLRGTGVQADRDQAVYWFKQAAERGNATAASNLGYIYANGIGVMADAAEAIAWYRRAVNLGHVESQDALRALQGATGVVAQRWQ